MKQITDLKNLHTLYDFHYGPSYKGADNCFQKSVDILVEFLGRKYMEKTSTLDLGCSLGRGSLALAAVSEKVTAVDTEESFITAVEDFQKNGIIDYAIDEGTDAPEKRRVVLNDIELSQLQEKVNFLTQESIFQLQSLDSFDILFSILYLERSDNPLTLLESLGNYVKKDGTLLLASTYSWTIESGGDKFWPADCKKKNNTDYQTAGIEEVLKGNFILAKNPINIDYIVRSAKSDLSHCTAEVTLWKKI